MRLKRINQKIFEYAKLIYLLNQRAAIINFWFISIQVSLCVTKIWIQERLWIGFCLLSLFHAFVWWLHFDRLNALWATLQVNAVIGSGGTILSVILGRRPILLAIWVRRHHFIGHIWEEVGRVFYLCPKLCWRLAGVYIYGPCSTVPEGLVI